LNRHQHSAPIEGICKHTTHDPEHHVWEHFGGLDK